MKSIHIIGSGFSSIASACYLAKEGFKVTVFEKNEGLGGRARQLKKEGFTFDMGPTWYWMPDVFEKFFSDFNKKPSDYYQLKKLSPAYKVYFGEEDHIIIPDRLDAIYDIFEKIERGSSRPLKQFINSAKANYELSIHDLVYKPGVSPFELVRSNTIFKLNQFFSTISKQVRKKIKDPRLIQILEFPVLFLGAKPSQTPAFYNFMNYADFGLGTWHPKGGMYEVVKAMVTLAQSLGVSFVNHAHVDQILVNPLTKKTQGLMVNGIKHFADVVLSGADYHHTETLLPESFRQYSESYWQRKTFAPSSLLFYVGFDKKIANVCHHSLFFDVPFEAHASDIYDHPKWPEKPLFYASFPSITDASFAPEGQEAATFLIPLAPGLKQDNQQTRQLYFEKIINRLEKLTNQSLKNNIIFMSSYGIRNFSEDYNSYKGNAYGLANTLKQTAFLRPRLKSKKVSNLYFTGQLTVPGPGVPPSLISGKIVTDLIIKK